MDIFKKNVGTADRIIRAIIGVIALSSTIYLEGILMYLVAIIGIALLITAMVGTCGVYMLFGIDTCKLELKKNKNKKNTKQKRKKIKKAKQ